MWYEGGKFIATTERAKSKVIKKKATGRVEIEPRVWVEGREGFRPILGLLCCEIYNRESNTFSFNQDLCGVYSAADVVAKRKNLIELYNKGERWISQFPFQS